MNKAILRIVGIALVVSPVIGIAQNKKPTAATYITKEDVDKVNATPGVDRTIKVMDIGDQHFSVGIIHRGKTRRSRGGGGRRRRRRAGSPAGQHQGLRRHVRHAERRVRHCPRQADRGLLHRRRAPARW